MATDDYNYLWWSKKAAQEMADLITQMGLRNCAVCDGTDSLELLPWPAVVTVGGFPGRPQGEQHRGNILFMAMVRCERCGHSMFFDSEKFSSGDEPVLWRGPGPPTE